MGARAELDAAADVLVAQMSRRAEVMAYAISRNISLADAVTELVNSALSETFPAGFYEGWHQATAAVLKEIESLPTPSVDQPSKRNKGQRHGN
jgi:hypothetical protein